MSHSSRSPSLLGPRPSVIDLLQDLDRFVPQTMDFDHSIATQVLTCAAWGLVRDYRQQCVVTRQVENQWTNGTLLLSSRVSELKRLLRCIHMGLDEKKQSNFDLLVLEILAMHLEMSLEQVHRFAGVEGPEEAKRVYPDLREWVKTASARQAISHAGAVLMLAERTSYLRDFAAVAVYQSALVLWSYGIVCNAAPSSGPQSVQSDEHRQSIGSADGLIILNRESTLAAQRFVTLNRGEAAILIPHAAPTADGTLVPTTDHVLISDPAAVMKVIMDILTRSYRSPSARPPLVDNLLGLIDSLRAAATTK